jgi:hypothetical protein
LGPGFAPEIVLTSAIFGALQAAQARVLNFVDDPHPATAELFDHSVVRDVLTDHFFVVAASWWRCPKLKLQISGEPS